MNYRRKLIEHKRKRRNQYMTALQLTGVLLVFMVFFLFMCMLYMLQAGPV